MPYHLRWIWELKPNISHGVTLDATLRCVVGAQPPVRGQGVHFTFGDTGFVRTRYIPDQHLWRNVQALCIFGLFQFGHAANQIEAYHSMSQNRPGRLHIYQNHTIDSTRWDAYEPRDDDIVIATPYKCGTTWMQYIVHNLIFMCEEGVSPGDRSPWIDFRPASLEQVMKRLKEQTHRRFIKSHLPLDGIPFFPQVKYIVVSRDVRDVFMSLWNHYDGYTQKAYDQFNNTPGRAGTPLPVCPKNIQDFWRLWITRGWFEWESEGYPFWSNMRHVQTWWDFRHLPNILFVHYNHLKDSLGDEILRVAGYLDIEVPEGKLEETMSAVSFDTVKKDAIAREKERAKEKPWDPIFTDGVRTFFFKGTNGRWMDVLTDEDLALYERSAQSELSPECRRWLEYGELE